MSFYNKILLILIGILLSLTAIDTILDVPFFSGYVILNTNTAAEISALIMMLLNGTFIDRSYHKIIYANIALIVLAMLFKIMHLPGRDQIFVIAMAALPIVYSVHFTQKEKKNVLDFLKLLLVLLYSVNGIILVLHLSFVDHSLLNVSFHAFFWFVFLYFIVERITKRRLFN